MTTLSLKSGDLVVVSMVQPYKAHFALVLGGPELYKFDSYSGHFMRERGPTSNFLYLLDQEKEVSSAFITRQDEVYRQGKKIFPLGAHTELFNAWGTPNDKM